MTQCVKMGIPVWTSQRIHNTQTGFLRPSVSQIMPVHSPMVLSKEILCEIFEHPVLCDLHVQPVHDIHCGD